MPIGRMLTRVNFTLSNSDLRQVSKLKDQGRISRIFRKDFTLLQHRISDEFLKDYVCLDYEEYDNCDFTQLRETSAIS